MEFENILLLLILIHIRWMKNLSKESSVASSNQNRLPRKIFRPKGEEDGSRRKLHNDELHGLYSLLKLLG
jgi:hypothetical protein